MLVAAYGDPSSHNEAAPAATRWVIDRSLEVYRGRVPQGPLLGFKPVHFVSGTEPQTLLHSLPRAYSVALTCLQSQKLNQVAYQVGHELFHVFADPRLIHPFMELLACTASLATLELLARELESGQVGGRQVGTHAAEKGDSGGGGGGGLAFGRYASKFRDYRAKVLDSAFQGVFRQDCIEDRRREQLAQGEWARTFAMGCDDRNHQLVAASMIEPLMTSGRTWSVFCLAAQAVLEGQDLVRTMDDGSECPDWRKSICANRWLAACKASPFCSPEDSQVVIEISALFGLGLDNSEK